MDGGNIIVLVGAALQSTVTETSGNITAANLALCCTTRDCSMKILAVVFFSSETNEQICCIAEGSSAISRKPFPANVVLCLSLNS